MLIPPAPGVFSALGLLFSDTEHEVVRTLMLRGDEVTAAALESAFAELEARGDREPRGRRRRDRHGDAASPTSATRARPTSCPSPCPPALSTSHASSRDFVAEHVRTYGHGSADDPIDVVSVRALARVERTAARRYDPLAAIRALPSHESVADAPTSAPTLGRVETPVCNRAGLLARRAARARS